MENYIYMLIICIVFIFMCVFNYLQTNMMLKNFKSSEILVHDSVDSKKSLNTGVMDSAKTIQEKPKNIVIDLDGLKQDDIKIYIQYESTGYELPFDVIENIIKSMYSEHFESSDEETLETDE